MPEKTYNHILISDLDGDLGIFDTRDNSFELLGNTGLVLTDVATSPGGAIYGIDSGALYEIDRDDLSHKKLFNLRSPDSRGLEFATTPDDREQFFVTDGDGRWSEYDTSGNFLNGAKIPGGSFLTTTSAAEDSAFYQTDDRIFWVVSVEKTALFLPSPAFHVYEYDRATNDYISNYTSNHFVNDLNGLASAGEDKSDLYGFANASVYTVNPMALVAGVSFLADLSGKGIEAITGAATVNYTYTGALNRPPTAAAVKPAIDLEAGKSIPLADLFTWDDPDGKDDVTAFAVRDRDTGGGYLTFDGKMKKEGKLFDDRPIDEIDRWRFVAGGDGDTDTIGFNAIDADGAFNLPSAAVEISSINPFSKPSNLLLEYFARVTAYDLKLDDADPGSSTIPAIEGYRVDEIFKVETPLLSTPKFVAVGLVSNGGSPVLAIRGTKGWYDWLANVNPKGVGIGQLDEIWEKGEIQDWLHANPGAFVVGHSQGGAQAQMITARALSEDSKADPIIIGGVRTFNSPGISDSEERVFNSYEVTDIIHYISKGDMVSHAGEAYLKGDVKYYNFEAFVLSNPLNFPGKSHSSHWSQLTGFTKFSEVGFENVDRYHILPGVSNSDQLGKRSFSHINAGGEFDEEYWVFLLQLAVVPFVGPILAAALTSRGATEDLRSGGTSLLSDIYDLLSKGVSAFEGYASAKIIAAGKAVKGWGKEAADAAASWSYDRWEDVSTWTAEKWGIAKSWTTDAWKAYADWTDSLLEDIWALPVKVWEFFAGSPDAEVIVADGSGAFVTSGSTPAVLVADDGGSTLVSTGGDTYFVAGLGADTIKFGGDGGIVWGIPAELDGDTLKKFDDPGEAVVIDAVGAEIVGLRKGSAILKIDTDGDGSPDIAIRLAGDFGGRRLSVVDRDGTTKIKVASKSTENADVFTGSNGKDVEILGGGADLAFGLGGNDRLKGGGGADTLIGGKGKDKLDGGSGNDRLDGGGGGDALLGGKGRDELSGGGGSDVFIFTSAKESKNNLPDKIKDFDGGKGSDTIGLSGIDAKTGRPGNQKFTFIDKDGFNGKKGELAYKHTAKNTVVKADTDGDGRADFKIILAGLHDLDHTDFIL